MTVFDSAKLFFSPFLFPSNPEKYVVASLHKKSHSTIPSSEYEDIIYHLLAENRVLRTKCSQLESNLFIRQKELNDYISQSTNDKLRLVEQSQAIMEEMNRLQMELAEIRNVQKANTRSPKGSRSRR